MFQVKLDKRKDEKLRCGLENSFLILFSSSVTIFYFSSKIAPPSLAYDLSFSSGVQQRSAEHPFYPRTQKDPRRKKRPKRRRSREIIQVYWTRELEHDFERKRPPAAAPAGTRGERAAEAAHRSAGAGRAGRTATAAGHDQRGGAGSKRRSRRRR